MANKKTTKPKLQLSVLLKERDEEISRQRSEIEELQQTIAKLRDERDVGYQKENRDQWTLDYVAFHLKQIIDEQVLEHASDIHAEVINNDPVPRDKIARWLYNHVDALKRDLYTDAKRIEVLDQLVELLSAPSRTVTANLPFEYDVTIKRTDVSGRK